MSRRPERRPRVALLTPATGASVSWVAKDIALLGELGCDVTLHPWQGRWHGIPDRLRISRLVIGHDLILCWFAYKHAYDALRVARPLGRPVVAIAAGFDVAQAECYAAWPAKWIRQRKWLLDNADVLLAVSEYAAGEARALTDSPVQVLYHGFLDTHFRPSGEKEPLAITVSAEVSEVTLERKGVAAFLRAAEYLPEVEFEVVGRVTPDAKSVVDENLRPNVKLLGGVSDDELLRRLQRAAVYVQASIHEAFGVAVAEAMLCECVPVVTRAAALPEVTGDTGIYVSSQEPLEIAKAVRQAVSVPEKGKAARERVLREFPLARRREGLRQLLERTLPDFPIGST